MTRALTPACRVICNQCNRMSNVCRTVVLASDSIAPLSTYSTSSCIYLLPTSPSHILPLRSVQCYTLVCTALFVRPTHFFSSTRGAWSSSCTTYETRKSGPHYSRCPVLNFFYSYKRCPTVIRAKGRTNRYKLLLLYRTAITIIQYNNN